MIDSVFHPGNRCAFVVAWRWMLAICCLVLLTAPLPVAKAQTERQSTQAAASDVELSPQEKKVIEYLQGVWGKDHSVMSVDQAMAVVGLRSSDETRFRIGQYIKQRPELHVIIRRWGWETLVLTPDEKLIARVISNAAREQQPTPTLAEITKAVGLSQNDVKRGLVMLERYQILKRDEVVGGAGYALAASRYLNWQPRLDFVFHRMTVSSGRNTSVNWAVDGLLLVSNKYAKEKVIIEDSSPESTARIRVEFDKGKLRKVEPKSAMLFMGGGWGVINLFSSEEALNQWLQRYPELKDRQRARVAEAFEEIKKREHK